MFRDSRVSCTRQLTTSRVRSLSSTSDSFHTIILHPRYERPAGLLITLYVYIVYVIALRFEGPFTDMIYSRKATSDAAKAGSKKEL